MRKVAQRSCDGRSPYNGQSITYDSMGNPLSYRGATLTWNGRKLMSYDTADLSIDYEYDANSLRTSKTINGVRHEYYYDENNQLIYEIKQGVYELYYKYDADGKLFSVTRYRYSDGEKHVAYAVTNTRGDVIELRSSTGAIYAKYVYDSWGKCISVTDSSGDASGSASVAVQNSIRYRGYVYDHETGLYYLQSRYYDPEVGRFLNADDVEFIGYSGDNLSYNAFAYCENNPVNGWDPSGEYTISNFSTQTWLTKLMKTLIGANIGYSTNIVTYIKSGVKLAIDVIAENAIYPNAKNRFSITRGKYGKDIDIEVAGVSFDINGGGVVYTSTYQSGITSSAVIAKLAKNSIGFGTSFNQILPYCGRRMSISLTLRVMLELTYIKITKSFAKVIVVALLPKVLSVAKSVYSEFYKFYKGTSTLRKLLPALTATLAKKLA